MLKRHCSSVAESLPHHVVELILERLPVKSLMRFKCVSKNWTSTIKSRRFKERQLIHRKQSRGPDVLFVRMNDGKSDLLDTYNHQRIVFWSSIASTVTFPISASQLCNGSCDGLICLYYVYLDIPNVVINPATRWYQTFPLSRIQQLLVDMRKKKDFGGPKSPTLGFGKDKISGTYKPVWLYNSSTYALANTTTCEVFDFTTNAWRYVHPASPYQILLYHEPVYLNGSLHWLTACEETKVLSFVLHAETFQVVAPFPHLSDPRNFNPRNVNMCVLDNRLCVYEKTWPSQVIWWLDSSSGNKSWKRMFSLDLTKTFSWYGEPEFPLWPIAILDKNKLLLQGREYEDPVVTHDLHTKSYDLLFKSTKPIGPVSYNQSLFSALSNYLSCTNE